MMAKNRKYEEDWIVLEDEKIRDYIPEGMTADEAEEYIYKVLEWYQKYQQQKREEPEER